ncbi:Alpha/Beta hydrolase protein [Zopfochytrium polystomum]|nr:Alpha/Beta hydrolase protein [Zopfochytrium polystomum]
MGADDDHEAAAAAAAAAAGTHNNKQDKKQQQQQQQQDNQEQQPQWAPSATRSASVEVARRPPSMRRSATSRSRGRRGGGDRGRREDGRREREEGEGGAGEGEEAPPARSFTRSKSRERVAHALSRRGFTFTFGSSAGTTTGDSAHQQQPRPSRFLRRANTTAQSLSPYDGHPDSDPFVSHPGWGSTLTSTIRVLRGTLLFGKDNLVLARSMTANVASPAPLNCSIKKVYVPRREDIVLDGMSANDAKGKITAEWVEFKKSDSTANQPGPSTPKSTGDGSALRRVVLYLHGGAYFICSRKTHRTVTWRVSKYSRCRLLVVDYRLAPEAVFPLALQDAISSFSYLIKECGYKPHEIVLYGDSAGGGLAFALSLWLRDNPEQGLGLPAGAALLSPWMDLTHSMPSFRVHGAHDYLPYQAKDPKYINENRNHFYVSDNSMLTNPYVSPFFAKEDPLRPLPPMMIQVGDSERLRDEILHSVNSTFKNSPMQLEIYEGMVHVFQMFATIYKLSEFALKRLGGFAQEVTTPGFNPARFRRHMTFVTLERDFPERELSSSDVEEMLRTTRMRLLASSAASGAGSAFASVSVGNDASQSVLSSPSGSPPLVDEPDVDAMDMTISPDPPEDSVYHEVLRGEVTAL